MSGGAARTPPVPVLAAVGLCLLGTSLAAAQPANAQPANAQPAGASVSAQTAAVLADEGHALMQQGKLAEACPRLAESQRLDPSPARGLTVGECFERDGKLASAWLHYRKAASLSAEHARAGADPDAAAAEARRREIAIEPRLSKVRVRVLGTVPGLQITRNEEVVVNLQWDVAVPVDDGFHAIEATATGHHPWRKRIQVGGAEVVTVMVPKLAPVEPEKTYLGVTIGSVVAASGLALVGVGLAYGFIAKNKRDDAEPHCPLPNACLQQGVTLHEEARNAATVSTATFVTGSILVAGGVVTWIVVPNTAADPSSEANEAPDAAEPPAAMQVTPVLTPELAGLWLGGRF